MRVISSGGQWRSTIRMLAIEADSKQSATAMAHFLAGNINQDECYFKLANIILSAYPSYVTLIQPDVMGCISRAFQSLKRGWVDPFTSTKDS